MELNEIMRTNGTCRYYTSEVVSDEVLAPVLDAARWAPTGGNRQPLRLIAVRDVAAKRRLKALYLPIWNSYVKGIEAGETRVQARPKLLEDADHFANHMDEIPIMLVV
jgi:nitroreductase